LKNFSNKEKSQGDKMKLFGLDLGKFLVDSGKFLVNFSLTEIVETIGEKAGLLSVERDEKGKALKRKFMGFGPEDEALNLLAWYQVFKNTGKLVKEEEITGECLLKLDRALDKLDILERIKVKQVLGMREKKVYSKVKEWFEPLNKETAKRKKPGPQIKHIETMEKLENVDGEKILLLFLSIMKAGENLSGGGEKALHDFLRGTILIKPSDIAKKLVETADAAIGEAIRATGRDPGIELANAKAAAAGAKLRYLKRKAARLARP